VFFHFHACGRVNDRERISMNRSTTSAHLITRRSALWAGICVAALHVDAPQAAFAAGAAPLAPGAVQDPADLAA
jgi:hypothetical protein